MTSKRIDWAKYARLLGKISDYRLAKELGISPEAVRQQRDKRGIPPCFKWDTRQKYIDWDSQPLGEMPDLQLAKKLKVSHTAVGKARRKRNIPRFSS